MKKGTFFNSFILFLEIVSRFMLNHDFFFFFKLSHCTYKYLKYVYPVYQKHITYRKNSPYYLIAYYYKICYR